MGTVVIESTSQAEILEEDALQLVRLRIVTEAADFAGLYTQLEVWRSTSASSGPFEELTAAMGKTARLPKTAGDAPVSPVAGRKVSLDGLTLEVTVDERDDFVVTFGSPVTLSDAASEVTAQGQGRFRGYVDAEGTFVVETTRTGVASTLRVTGGDAAVLLGLSTTDPDNYNFGRDPRLALDPAVEEYSFTDPFSSGKYFYRTRFRNGVTQAASEYSQSFQTGTLSGLSSSGIVRGYVDLVSGSGAPLVGQLVQVYNAFKQQLVEGRLVTGSTQSAVTDARGHAEFDLVRGASYTVAIAGTGITRDIVAPTDASVATFSLLGADIGTGEDAFTVQVPDIILAPRRTL